MDKLERESRTAALPDAATSVHCSSWRRDLPQPLQLNTRELTDPNLRKADRRGLTMVDTGMIARSDGRGGAVCV